MKNHLKQKLRSNQGMTLLLSLLLFLVCAVAGSVALTAGTATSGTLSERAKLDQRYFSVTSAAELIREKFNRQDVCVTYVTAEGTNVVKSTIQREGVDESVDYDHANTEGKFVIDQSLYLLNTQFKDDPDWQQFGFQADTLTSNAENWLKTYVVTVHSDVEDTSGLNATVEISRERPENLNFLVTSAIPRKDPENPFGEKKPEKEKFNLNVNYNASSLKTGAGQNAAYHVNWEVGTISYAN